MDYGFDEDQEMLRWAVRDFMARECPRPLVREIEEHWLDYSSELYGKMADLGWCGLMIPEEYGGSNYGWLEMAVFYEEAGRAICPSPHYQTCLLAGQTILALGAEAQKHSFLPRIASGDIVIACCIAEPHGADAASMLVAAVVDGDGYVINGTKLFVPLAHRADYLLVVARTADASDGASGITNFLIERSAPGVSIDPMDAIGGERLCEVVFHDVRVPADTMLGPRHGGEPIFEIEDRAKVMLGMYMTGFAQVATDMTVEFSRNRVQFGVPIGSFQSLQFRMADMWTYTDATRWLLYETTWKMSQGSDTPADRAAAQAQACLNTNHVVHECVHLHGALGVMRDFDASLFFSRAKAIALYIGPHHDKQAAIAAGIGL